MAEETETIKEGTLSETDYKPTKKEEKLIEKWEKRLKNSKEFFRPYKEKRLRMYKLYRAYREKTNYAYETNLMPPIAFEIVETVKPRLASAKTNVRIFPRSKGDVKSSSIEEWDNLIRYYLDTPLKFKDRKIDLINSTLIFGDGIYGLVWKPGKEKDGDPFGWVQDLWLFHPDPEATDLQEDSRYEIVEVFKSKAQLIKEEKKRKDQYAKTKTKKGKVKEGEFDGGIYENLDYVTDQEITDDPRKERYEINTKKMGVIAKGKSDEGTATDKKLQEKKVKLWQIFDHEEDKLIVIANEKVIVRDDESSYKNVNNGRTFFHLSDHRVLWELWSIGHIEPIETTIHEIADSRNQAMDSIIFNLDPIRKVRKEAHLTADDLVHEPGAIWQLKKADDVIIERPAEISKTWLEKDAVLRKEIQMALAVSEYAMGLPKSSQEPHAKVDLLLLQTSLRFSLLLRQFEILMTQVVNNLIEMSQEFLSENKAYRLIDKKGAEFKEFKDKDKKVKVDAIVEIKPVVEKTPEKRKAESLELYKIFVGEDKPDPKDEKELERWKIRKRTLQKMILEDYGKEQYEDLILGPEEKEKEKKSKPEVSPEKSAAPSKEKIPLTPRIEETEGPTGIKGAMSRIPFLGKFIK